MQTVLITGANRGIGLEFTHQYLTDGWQVLAGCRDPHQAEALKKLASSNQALEVVQLDVCDQASVAQAANNLQGRSLDLIINNAGIYGPRNRTVLGDVDYEAWAQVMDVNMMGPMRVAEAFAGHLANGNQPVLAAISSRMGSIGENTSGNSYIYRSSKAALNAVVKSLSIDLADRGITVVAFHPGWVQTDMGGPSATVTPEASVTGMRKTIAGLSLQNSAAFLNFDGTPIAW